MRHEIAEHARPARTHHHGGGEWTLGALGIALVAAVGCPLPAMSHGEDPFHEPGMTAFDPNPLLWGGATLAGMLLLVALVQVARNRRAQADAPTEAGVSYLGAVRRFGRNARLYLGYSLLAELGSGIWSVMFNQLAMDFAESRERGTTAGFTHTAFDLGGGVGAGIAGVLITDGSFVTAFTAAAALILAPAFLYYRFFNAAEEAHERSPKLLAAAGVS